MKCTFCSASLLSKNQLSIEQIDQLIQKINIKESLTTICLEGGEPLTRSPQFFEQLIELVETKYPKIQQIGMTSNLWAFYKNPTKWTPILSHKLIDACTSFQYGTQRRVSDKIILTEQLFEQIYNMYLKYVQKPLSFISVISEENNSKILQTVQLAKRLQTICKINPVLPQGRSTSYYGFHNIINDWTDIIVNGYSDYEANSHQLLNLITQQNYNNHDCVFNRNCGEIYSSDNVGNLSVCSIYRDYYKPVKFYNKQNILDPKRDPNMFIIKPQCLQCSNFKICNSCRIHIDATKQFYNVEMFCKSMSNSINKVKQWYDQNN